MPSNPSIRTLNAPRAHLGEGPSYDPVTDTAWWVDILERRLFEAPLGGDTVREHALPFMASAIAAVDGGRHLLAAEDGLSLRGIMDGRIVPYCPIEAEDAGTRSNDGRVHPCGAFWISTMGRDAQPGRGAIYHVAGTTVTRLYAGLAIPNAICFSPDGATAYFADTAEGLLRRVAVDPSTGLPVAEPATLYDHRGGAGGIDGATVDAQGLIWSARWGAGCIDAHSPDGGRVRSVRVPASRPSCPTFAGRDLRHLLVTSAYEGMDADARAADPHHGRTFLVALGVEGLLEPRFRL